MEHSEKPPDSRGKELPIPETFLSKVTSKTELQLVDVGDIRQRAELMVESSLMFNGLEHTGTTLVDSLVLNTATATPRAVKEFMDHHSGLQRGPSNPFNPPPHHLFESIRNYELLELAAMCI
jgi:hypothetical protein